MSIMEKYVRYQYLNNTKLFIKEKNLNMTISRINYGSFTYRLNGKHSYDKCWVLLYDRKSKVHFRIYYNDVKKHMIERMSKVWTVKLKNGCLGKVKKVNFKNKEGI